MKISNKISHISGACPHRRAPWGMESHTLRVHYLYPTLLEGGQYSVTDNGGSHLGKYLRLPNIPCARTVRTL